MTTRARLMTVLTVALLLVGVLLVFATPIVCIESAGTAGDASRMAMAGLLAELVGMLASGIVVNLLKKARDQRGSRSPAQRSALIVARTAFWSSILITMLLSCGAIFFWMMAFGLSG